MLSNGFAKPIRLEPVASKAYRYFVLSTHALAVLALLHPSSLMLWIRLILVMGVIVCGVYHYRRYTDLHHSTWIWLQSGDWRSSQDHFQTSWRLSRVFSLTRYFVALRLINDVGRRQDVLWFCDQFEAACFRRLRVRLAFAQVEATRPGETI